MTQLKDYKNHIDNEYLEVSQKIAEAIQAVLGIEVTIMDHKRSRIAGTGRYKDMINQSIESNTAFDYCLSSGRAVEILQVGESNPLCQKCPRLNHCLEKAEICVPIKASNGSIGVIGIIAFTDKQKDRIIDNKDSYLNFLFKMASLLESNYLKNKMESENKTLTDRLSVILEIMNEAVVVYDGNGAIIYKNAAITKLTNEIGAIESNIFLNKVWRYVDSKNLLEQLGNDPNEIIIEHNNEKYLLLAYITTILSKGVKTEIIVSLHNQKKITKKIMQSAEKNQVRIVFDDILSFSKIFDELKKSALKAALTNSNIIVSGESGTGKELFARAMHNCSLRSEYPFVPINCGAVPENLLESEFFGYEKGAFTGAEATKIGKFELAEKGTIFLDEISEMPFRLQVKLLRVIQEKEICRLGSNKIRKIDVRIISATNVKLLDRIQDGSFRKDLYYRLNIIPLNLPPLRERANEIIEISNYFVQKFAMASNKQVSGISPEAKELLLSYGWPGNIRELQNVIEYAVAFENGDQISGEVIRKRLNIDRKDISSKIFYDSEETLEAILQRYEKKIIKDKVEYYRNSELNNSSAVDMACKSLGISRATYYRKLKGSTP